MNNPSTIFSQLLGNSQTSQYTQQVNSLLTQAAPAMLCGPECQKTKESASLQQNYVDAQTNLKNAPGELYTARKNYLVNLKGTSGYTTSMTAEYTVEASTITQDAQTEFNKNIESATNMINTYDSLYTNNQYLTEFLTSLKSENNTLQTKVSDENADVITNDRKSYYETQGYNVLVSWYFLFIIVYGLLLVVFSLGMFLSPSNYSMFTKIGILLFFILYPFVITYIILFVLSGLQNIAYFFPKNIYVSDSLQPPSFQTPLNVFNNVQR